MRMIECVQGDELWMRSRLGVPTASEFDKICTPTGKLSASCSKYLARLCAEWYLGESLSDFNSGFMERGTGMEVDAARWYEFDRDCVTVPCGLCLRADGKVGASPDRLVGDEGLLEVKCPSAENHMLLLLGGLGNDYRVQCQGQLWITQRKWVDLLAYHPVMPRTVVRIERDEKFIELLADSLELFIARLDGAKERFVGDKASRDAQLAEMIEDPSLHSF